VSHWICYCLVGGRLGGLCSQETFNFSKGTIRHKSSSGKIYWTEVSIIFQTRCLLFCTRNCPCFHVLQVQIYRLRR